MLDIRDPLYADLRLNTTLCSRFAVNMNLWGDKVCEFQEGCTGGSTDQGEFKLP